MVMPTALVKVAVPAAAAGETDTTIEAIIPIKSASNQPVERAERTFTFS